MHFQAFPQWLMQLSFLQALLFFIPCLFISFQLMGGLKTCHSASVEIARFLLWTGITDTYVYGALLAPISLIFRAFGLIFLLLGILRQKGAF